MQNQKFENNASSKNEGNLKITFNSPILDNVSELILYHNNELKILWANKAASESVNLTTDKLIGGHCYEIWHQRNAPCVNCPVLKTIETGQSHEAEQTTPDGRVWKVKASPVKDNNDNIIGAVEFVLEITKRKETEQKLKESEAKYRFLFENSPYAIILANLKGRVIDCNSATERLFGYRKDTIVGKTKNQLDIYPQERLRLLKDRFETLIKGGEISPIEVELLNVDGQKLWVSLQSSLIKFGSNIYIQTIYQDINERKTYENLIYEINISFLKFTPDFQSNIKTLIQTVKKLSKAESVLYIQKSIQNGNKMYQIISSDDNNFNCNKEEFKKNYFTNEAFELKQNVIQTFLNLNETQYAKTDPFIIKYNIKGGFGKLIKSEDKFNSFICILKRENPAISHQEQMILYLVCDVIKVEEQRWQIQKNLKEQNIRLSEINKFKTDLLNRTSHELKTPLVSIKGFSDFLLAKFQEKYDNETLSILKEIKQGCVRLDNIINSLLESSQLESGQLKLILKQGNLSELIKSCLKEMQAVAEMRNQSIYLNIDDNLITNFDIQRIYEVFSNLLINAINYTPPGGEIKIFSEVKSNFFIISIEDNGIGFSAEEKNQLFKQFGKIERYGQGWDVGIEGTGLGLYIAKKIIELHGGNIWMESAGRNRGSKFSFSIPILRD